MNFVCKKGEKNMTKWTDYFNPSYRFFLQNVQYERIEAEKEKATMQLNDQLEIQDLEDHAILRYTRKAFFEPQQLFNIIITFAAELEYSEEYRIKTVENRSQEALEVIKELGEQITSNLSSRASMVLAQLTSSSGQMPVITPPIAQSMLNKK